MEPAEVVCKKIANRMLSVLSQHLHPVSVEFVENSPKTLKSARQRSIAVLGEKDAERAAEILVKTCSDITECIELSVPEGFCGVTVTACNISIRVLAEPFENPLLFRVDICYR